MGEEGLKLRAGTIIKDDVLSGIAPTRDMIDGSGELKTQRTCHGAGISKKDSRPLFLSVAGPFHFPSWKDHPAFLSVLPIRDLEPLLFTQCLDVNPYKTQVQRIQRELPTVDKFLTIAVVTLLKQATRVEPLQRVNV